MSYGKAPELMYEPSYCNQALCEATLPPVLVGFDPGGIEHPQYLKHAVKQREERIAQLRAEYAQLLRRRREEREQERQERKWKKALRRRKREARRAANRERLGEPWATRSANLLALRLHAGLSQYELGFHQSDVSKWESGVNPITDRTLHTLAAALGVPVEALDAPGNVALRREERAA